MDATAVGLSCVHVFYQQIGVLEVHVGVLVGEVAAHRHDDVVGAEGRRDLVHVGHEGVDSLVDVVLGAVNVVLNRLVLALVVEAEGLRVAVRVVQHAGEETFGEVVAALRSRVPQHLERLHEATVGLLSEVHPLEEDGVEAGLQEDVGLVASVSERVYLPGDPRPSALAEGGVEEANPFGQLVYRVGVGHTRLVRHAPTAEHELQLPVADQASNQPTHRFRLLAPPAREEGHLDVREPPLRIGRQRLYHTVQNVLDPGALDVTLRAVVVLVHRLQPADVVVCVCDQVDIQEVGLCRVTRLISTPGLGRPTLAEAGQEGQRNEEEEEEEEGQGRGTPCGRYTFHWDKRRRQAPEDAGPSDMVTAKLYFRPSRRGAVLLVSTDATWPSTSFFFSRHLIGSSSSKASALARVVETRRHDDAPSFVVNPIVDMTTLHSPNPGMSRLSSLSLFLTVSLSRRRQLESVDD
ncbi:unnamed protein product [Protopolystoma xenopodis]|uniref:Uncharacterized protein n=1 Tax=Protopolystoma xenopodis TaxID=117903 RepID=A0A448XP27_9PLAT|nr:unnamed protein product [Protopolystoma xenopodis]